MRPFYTGLTYKLLRKVVVKANTARTKGGVVVFGESQVQHYHREKQARHWKLDGNVVDELDEYKSIGAVKNYTSTSRLDIFEAIEKTRKRQECF